MPKRSKDSRLRGATILFAGAALSAVLLAPTLGSAANLSATPFAVKAQNSTDSSRFAVKPFFSATPTAPATTTPTAPPTTTPAVPVATVLKTYTLDSTENISGWGGGGEARHGSSSPSPHSGNGYLYFSTSSASTYYVRPPADITYTVGQTYKVSGWVYNENFYKITSQLVTQNDATTASPVISAVNTWTKVESTFVAKSANPSINFVFVVGNPTGAIVRLDDVTISQIS